MGAGQSQANNNKNFPSFVKKPLPKDKDGFVQSFSLKEEEDEEAKRFFEEYGLVIFRDVLTQEEIEKAVDGVWEQVNSIVSGLDKNDPSSWWVFPSGHLGLLGSDIADTKSAWELRQNPNVYKSFSKILETEDLLVSVDRYGLMRPTKDVKMKDGTTEDHPEWKTKEAWFHWDLNPWTYGTSPKKTLEEELETLKKEEGYGWKDPKSASVAFISENNTRSKAYFGDVDKVQGLLAFEDSGEKDGGFQCVPGFQKFLGTWAQKVPQSNATNYVSCPREDDDIYPNVERVTMRKGSLLIWSGQLPHCSFPNNSNKFRICQYLKMFPRTVLPLEIDGYLEARCEALKLRMPADFEVNEVGQQVYGFKYV